MKTISTLMVSGSGKQSRTTRIVAFAMLVAIGCGDSPPDPEESEQQGHVERGPSAMVSDLGWTVSDHVRLARDINSDHRTDLVGFGSDGVYIASALSGGGFGNPTKVITDFHAS